MTRDDLVNLICTSTGYVESDDVAACETFIQRRDRMIYESALWKDSLVMVLMAIDPVGNTDHAAGVVLLPEIIGRVVAVRTPDNAVRVNGVETYFRIDLDKFQEQSSPFEFAIQTPVWFRGRPGQSVALALANNADAGQAFKILWEEESGARHKLDGVQQWPINLQPTDAAANFWVTAVFKPVTLGLITATINGVVYTLAASDTRSPSYQQIRLVGTPTQATTLRILGKRPYQPLDFATEEPFLRNSENALIAFTRGDVLQRGGENGNAQAAYQEGAALLQSLKDLEAVQAANNQRIIPDAGYGPEYGIGPYTRPYF